MMSTDVYRQLYKIHVNNVINYKSSKLRVILQRLNYKIHLDAEL
jgi:hypothetical protein